MSFMVVVHLLHILMLKTRWTYLLMRNLCEKLVDAENRTHDQPTHVFLGKSECLNRRKKKFWQVYFSEMQKK